jgi:hypothetical protein
MAWSDAARAASLAVRRAHALGTPLQRSIVAKNLRQARYHLRQAALTFPSNLSAHHGKVAQHYIGIVKQGRRNFRIPSKSKFGY